MQGAALRSSCEAACRSPAARRSRLPQRIGCNAGDAGGRPSKPRGPAPPAAQRREGLQTLLPPQAPPKQLQGSDAASLDAQGGQALPPATLLLCACGAFVAVASDVSGANGGLHLLQFLDGSAHAWVSGASAAWSAETQRLVAGKLVSDAAIVAGLAGWAAIAAAALQTRCPRLLQGLALAGAGYWLGGGRIWGSDPWLVDQLKNAFQRARPTVLYNTFAFPSGHTTAASFVVGTLLFVLLPLATAALARQAAEQEQQEASASDGTDPAGSQWGRASAWLLERRWQLWGAGVVLTATGRVLADVHWTSDTMAGACLGAALTAGIAQLCGIPDLGNVKRTAPQERQGRQRSQ